MVKQQEAHYLLYLKTLVPRRKIPFKNYFRRTYATWTWWRKNLFTFQCGTSALWNTSKWVDLLFKKSSEMISAISNSISISNLVLENQNYYSLFSTKCEDFPSQWHKQNKEYLTCNLKQISLGYVVPSLLVPLNSLSWQLGTTTVFIDKAHITQYKLVGLKYVLVIGKIIPGLQTVGSVIFYDSVSERWLPELMSWTGTHSLRTLFLQPKIHHLKQGQGVCEHTLFFTRMWKKRGQTEAGGVERLPDLFSSFPDLLQQSS